MIGPPFFFKASRALALLAPADRAGVLRYFHVRDAKMAIASALLKRFAVARLAPSPPQSWSDILITRDARTKPVWVDPSVPDANANAGAGAGADADADAESLRSSPVSFNVTHQAGVVALVAAVSTTLRVHVGVDIVCTSERRDRDRGMAHADGWPAFVDAHADVFAPAEASYLKYQVLSAVPGLASSAGTDTLDAKLRAFYALWALREAFVKLTGDALLAEWLRELEFRRFRPPAPTPAWDVPAREGDGGAGAGAGADDDGERYGPQVIRRTEIRLRGKRVDDVNLCLRSMGPDFMICTVVRTPDRPEVGLRLRLGPYEVLNLEDVLTFAESRMP